MVELEKIDDVEKLLKDAIDAKKDYLKAESDYRREKARLRLETDWSEASESRMTDKDKEAYVNFHSIPLKELKDDLKAKADYQWELWELQKLILRKGSCYHG